jgi:transketolase
MISERQARDLREVMVDTLIAAADEGLNLITLVSDSTSTAKIAPFKNRHPDRLVNVGIAEQCLVGMAAGMALGGAVSMTANAAAFLVHRANEQVKNDVCYTNTNVKLVGLNAGVCYGALASTHHAIDDISIMRGFGNIVIFAPSDPLEAEQIFKYALHYKGPVYIRMDSMKFPILHDDDYRFQPGKVDILRPGGDISIVAMGSTVHEAVAAGEVLAGQGIDVEVINLTSIRPLDSKGLVASLRKTGLALTVEEHSLHGGVGSIVAAIAAEEGLGCRVKRLGFAEGSFPVTGPRDEMRARAGIDAPGIIRAAKELLVTLV